MCKVIKNKNDEPGFDRALSFIFFQKWLDIVPASADERPISANDDSECILLQQEINQLDWKFLIQCIKSLAYPTKGQYRESGTSCIGNDWK